MSLEFDVSPDPVSAWCGVNLPPPIAQNNPGLGSIFWLMGADTWDEVFSDESRLKHLMIALPQVPELPAVAGELLESIGAPQELIFSLFERAMALSGGRDFEIPTTSKSGVISAARYRLRVGDREGALRLAETALALNWNPRLALKRARLLTDAKADEQTIDLAHYELLGHDLHDRERAEALSYYSMELGRV